MAFDITTDAAIMSAVGGLLKEDWITNLIKDQYSRDTVLMSLLEKNSQDVEGLEAVFTMRLAPNLSTAARSEMAQLPDPGRQLTKRCRIPLSYWYTSVAFSGPAIQASKSNSGSLARVITDELDNAVKDHKQVENFFFYGDGSGYLASITDIAGNVITVDRWASVFTEGRRLDSFTAKSGGSQHLDGALITAVDRAAKTITVDAIGTAATSDCLFLDGMRGYANMGLLGIVDDGTFVSTFQGLSRSSYSKVKARVFSGTGATAADRLRTVSESLLMDVVARMREDGARPDLLIGTSFQLNDLCKEAVQQRQFIDPKKKISLGIEGIEIGDGVTFTYDPDALPGYTWALTKKDLAIIENSPLGFMDKDGNVLSRITGPRRDGYEATLAHYFNLCAYACYTHARIEDIAENRVGD